MRMTARTIAQQVGPAVKAATAPFQYALSTRADCECIAHALQAVCELDPDTTGTSIDGISAYDSISRRAMPRFAESGREQRSGPICAHVLLFTVILFVGR